MVQGLNFKRIVLGLQPSTSDRSMYLAVDLADLLQLELLGLYIEDTSVRHLANMPFARELKPLGRGWQSIDPKQLSHEFALTASSIKRAFATAAKRLPIPCQFEVIQGPTIETIASISRTNDVIMVVEPANPVERATQQFIWFIEAAFQSAAAVMLVPSQIVRTTGPVVAIVKAVDDPSFDAGAAIAIAAREELILIEARENVLDHTRIRKLSDEIGLTIKSVVAGSMAFSDPSGYWGAIPQVKERLVVMHRSLVGTQPPFMIASVRRVPVLVIEPSNVGDFDATSSGADPAAAEREKLEGGTQDGRK